MPLYDFYCKNCNLQKEVLLNRANKNREIFCEKCGELMQKKICAPVVIYKGSGFYSTDYAKK